MATSVSATISSTSQPLQTGFSTGGGTGATETALNGGKGFGALGNASALTVGCASNCGLSEDDKVTLS